MLPNATDLQYFLEVANTQNISRAAERLGVSQPSVSIGLKRLEEQVGEELLIRTKKGIHLTKAGEELLKYSHSLLESWQNVVSHSKSSMNEVKGNLKIGCHPSVGLYTLKYFMPKLISKNRELEVSFLHGLSREITESVISLKTDIGIVVNPVKHPDLVINKLCDDYVHLWQSKNEENSDVLICDQSLIQSQDIIKKFKKFSIDYNRVISTSSLENIVHLTASGTGVGIIPKRVVESIGVKNIEEVPGSPKFHDEICVIYRVENKNVKSIMEIVRQIKSSVS